ncbi:MAG: hypothetical protein Q7S22_00305 [Candidatus Micrarchaeota archaeon]|nr:hypothetical protein [Candidatus Micrarchaeota archaeon]
MTDETTNLVISCFIDLQLNHQLLTEAKQLMIFHLESGNKITVADMSQFIDIVTGDGRLISKLCAAQIITKAVERGHLLSEVQEDKLLAWIKHDPTNPLSEGLLHTIHLQNIREDAVSHINHPNIDIVRSAVKAILVSINSGVKLAEVDVDKMLDAISNRSPASKEIAEALLVAKQFGLSLTDAQRGRLQRIGELSGDFVIQDPIHQILKLSSIFAEKDLSLKGFTPERRVVSVIHLRIFAQ